VEKEASECLTKRRLKQSFRYISKECIESSRIITREAFHPDARVSGRIGGQLQDQSAASFADFVESKQPSAKEKGDEAVVEIISLQINGETAVARVRDEYLGMTFLDNLAFLKIDQNWSIYLSCSR